MKIKVDIDTSGVNRRKLIHRINNDEGLWTFAATEWHRLYKKYVPFESGALRDTVVIRPKEIEHTVPYAHYQYEGVVYSPSFPITENGIITGFFSKRNTAKKKTHRLLTYKNALASRKWDKKAKSTQKTALIEAVQGYIDSGRLKLNE